MNLRKRTPKPQEMGMIMPGGVAGRDRKETY